MKVSEMRFSYALGERPENKEKQHKDERVAFLSIEFDNSLIIHHIEILKKGSGHFYLKLPVYKIHACNQNKTGRFNPSKGKDIPPLVWFSSKEVFNKVSSMAVAMYKQLLVEYGGQYSYKRDGNHNSKVNISTLDIEK